tara:strand:+ start:212 stop:661 length:450 start_codon:yes stop_codon:yes gene_type:complete
MKNFIATLTCFCFLLSVLTPSLAYAEEKVTTLQLGDPAPFAGTLFNTEATARILAELELNEEACELRVNRAVELKEAELQLTIDQLQIRLDTSSEIFEQRLQIRDQQIQFLDKELTRTKIHPAWWFVGGIVVGSLTAIGTAHAMNQVSQ